MSLTKRSIVQRFDAAFTAWATEYGDLRRLYMDELGKLRDELAEARKIKHQEAVLEALAEGREPPEPAPEPAGNPLFYLTLATQAGLVARMAADSMRRMRLEHPDLFHRLWTQEGGKRAARRARLEQQAKANREAKAKLKI